MSTADKLNKLIETKEAIRQSIIAKGTDVGEDVPFSQYPSKIDEIQTGGGESYVNPGFYEMRTNGGTNFKGLFYYATGNNFDLTCMDVSKAADMSNMFTSCYADNINISNWDVSNVTNVAGMFSHFGGKIDISNLVFNKVTSSTSSKEMFAYATTLNYIKGLQNKNPIPNVPDLSNLFSSATYNGYMDLSLWNIEKVNTINSMFYSLSCASLDLSNWKTTNVTKMSGVFSFSSNNGPQKLIIPDWDMTNTTSSYSDMFGYSGSSAIKNLYYIDLSRSNDTTVSIFASRLYAKNESRPGEIVIPDDTSEDIVNALIAKYWRPIGPKLELTSCELVPELNEVLLGETTKIHIGNCNPWYGDRENNIEFVVVNDDIASVDENGILTAHSVGSTEVYAVFKDSKSIISNTITINVVENYTNINEFKFKLAHKLAPDTYYVNDTKLSTSNSAFDNVTQVWTHDAGKPISSLHSYTYNHNISEIIKVNTGNITNMEEAFYGLSCLTSIKEKLDLSNCNKIRRAFSHCYNLEDLRLINIFKNATVLNNINIGLEDTKVKDDCLMSIISELPDLNNDNLTVIGDLIFTLPPTNTLTAEQVQSAIDKGWTVANVNPNVLAEALGYSLRQEINTNKVYKLVENENGNYQSQDGTMYDILEVNNAVSPEGINVGWTPFDNLEQAMIVFGVTYIERELDEEI